MAIVIRGTGKALPKRYVPNGELGKELDTSDEWIRTHTGIEGRYIAGEGETASSLGAEACKAALARSETPVRAEDLALVVCATITPEFSGCPAAACLIQDKIGAANAGAFDLSSACTGFINALQTAAALLEHNNWRYALVCASETLSRIVDWSDRATCVLFGDGAGAVLLENTAAAGAPEPLSAGGKRRGIGGALVGSDGAGGAYLYVDERQHLQMDGKAVYLFAVKIIVDIIERLMKQESLSADGVDLFVCHQANSRILDAAVKRMQIPKEKMVYGMKHYGNTSAASIPLAFADLADEGRLKPGMTVLTAGFGAGLTWGGCVIRW
ncbi:beta-ketoacyl-ACP synthase III [Treponema endosymbiont of Eucomonympha sp.]|uniref:beta-ketoacyl-ACP synthase III n=1 Tax=Treponema endosymbiont of Eucomonympha sp. TaxID=1580831 RepID=UPI000782F901|nr:beta-ketoacyl-ACP synthase III [Treponema endosymbiont of Eucomonympha sp.]